MAAFATTDEFAIFLGRAGLGELANLAQAEQALAFATGLVQEYTGQHLFYVADDTVELWPRNGGQVVVLPEMPAVSVSAVLDEDGEPVGWTLRPGGVLRLDSTQSGPVTVTYSHGYETIPNAVKAATMQTASRLTTNPTEVRQQAAGSFSVTYGSAPELSNRERQSLSRYRMPAVV